MKIFRIAKNEQLEFSFAKDTEEDVSFNPDENEETDETDELPIDNGYINKLELQDIIQNKKLSVQTFPGLLKVQHNGESYFFEDYDEDEYRLIDDPQQWIYDTEETDALDILQLKEEDVYMGGIDTSLKSLRENPGSVFHWTTEEKWDEIQRSGRLKGSYGTGLNNRSAYGIFTSVDPEEYEIGSYGNVCLEIDLAAFKQEYGGDLDLNVEPEALESVIREALAYHLGIDMHIDQPSDISPFTVIVNHVIPVRYVKRIN